MAKAKTRIITETKIQVMTEINTTMEEIQMLKGPPLEIIPTIEETRMLKSELLELNRKIKKFL